MLTVRLVLLTALSTLSLVGTASAGSVVILGGNSIGFEGGMVAEVNTVTITVNDAANTVVVEDTVSTVSSPGGICSPTTPNKVTCSDPAINTMVQASGGGGNDTITLDGDAIGVSLSGGDGDDVLTGSQAYDTIAGGIGNDTILGRGGEDQIDALSGAGGADTIDGGNGFDVVGFLDADVVQDTGAVVANEFDSLLAFQATAGVTLRIDNGLADDGLTGVGGGQVKAGFEDFELSGHADVVVGSAAAERIYGTAGNDQLTGGGGVDTLQGNDGDDTLTLNDGVADHASDCGTGTDTAIVDASGDTVTNCETVTVGSSSGGTGGGGGGTTTTPTTTTPTTTPGAPTPAKPGVEVAPLPTRKFRFPDFTRPTKTCGRKLYCEAADVASYFEKRRINYELTVKPAQREDLEAIKGKKVEAGEILRTNRDGRTVQSGPNDVVKVNLFTFSSAQARCRPSSPFVRIDQRLVNVTDILEGMNLYEAQRYLKAAKCGTDDLDFDYRYSSKVSDAFIDDVRISGGGDNARFDIVVLHPEARLQLTLTTPPLGKSSVPPVFGDHNEIVLPGGRSVGLVEVDVEVATANGIGFANGIVGVRNRSGETVSGPFGTNAESIAGQRIDPRVGERYEVFASVADRDGQSLVGWKLLRVIKPAAGRVYIGIDGKRYTLVKGKFGPASGRAVASASRAATRALADDRRNLSNAAARIALDLGSSFLEAAEADFFFGQRANAMLQRFLAAAKEVNASGDRDGLFDGLVARGFKPLILAGAGSNTPQLTQAEVVPGAALVSKGGRLVSQPSYVVNIGLGALALEYNGITLMPGGAFTAVRSGGTAANGTGQVRLDATASGFDIGSVGFAPVVGIAGRAGLLGTGGLLIGNTIPGLIGNDGATLIGNDGSTLLSAGAALIGNDGATLIGNDGATLIGNDGATLIGLDGATLIGNDGSTLVGDVRGGMSLIAGSGAGPAG